jgi:hypothetical protein
MSTLKATNFQHPSAGAPAIVLDSAGGATVAGMGLVAVAPTSTANSGGTVTVNGNTTTFTGVNNFSLNGVFSSTYDNYRIMLTFVSTNADEDLNLRLRAAGVDAATNYDRQNLGISATTVFGGRTTGQTSLTIAGGVSNTARNSITAEIFSPNLAAATTFTVINYLTTSSARVEFNFGRHTTTSAYDGFTMIPQNGASTLTGTISVFGYKK